MDQLSLTGSKKQLSSLFDTKFKRLKFFILISQNRQLLILITSFLGIADILKLSVASQQLHKIIEGNSQIQNRVLKAQVAYLTKEQQKNIETSPLYNTLNKSAYSMFQSYWDNTPVHIDQRLKKLQSGQAHLADSFLAFVIAKVIPQNKKQQIMKNKKQSSKKFQQKTAGNSYGKNNLKIQSNFSQGLIKQQSHENQLIANDRELQLLTKWEVQAGQKSYQEKMKRLVKMSKQERRNLVIQKFKENNVPFQQVAPPDKSLIIAEVTIWDRIKSRFAQNR